MSKKHLLAEEEDDEPVVVYLAGSLPAVPARLRGSHSDKFRPVPSSIGIRRDRGEWSALTLTALDELWSLGYSTAAIGDYIGFTKNAVVGKSHRRGLPGRESPIIRDPAKIQSADEARTKRNAHERALRAASGGLSTLPPLPSLSAPPPSLSAPLPEIVIPVPRPSPLSDRLREVIARPVVVVPVVPPAPPRPVWTPPKPRPPRPPVVVATEPVIAEPATIRKWAGERGIIMDKIDLAWVNAKRADLGQALFALPERRYG